MAGEKPLSGGPAIAIPGRALWRAVDATMRQLSRESLSGMKIRAGEHLATLVTASFLGTAPSRVDVGGGVDLWYDLQDGWGRDVLGLSDDVVSAAFEVKSIGRTYREWEAAINKVQREGGDARGREMTATITSANDVLRQVQPSLRRAGEQLDAKLGSDTSKNVFILVNPFDHPVVECLTYPIIGRLLDPLQGIGSVETVWVLWVPDHMTLWSARNGTWADLIIAQTPGDPHVPGPLSVLQEAESYFLSRLPQKDVSPFLFSWSAK